MPTPHSPPTLAPFARCLGALIAMWLATGLTGCGNAAAHTGDTGPNGGFVVALRGAGEEAYLEILNDESEPRMTVHVLDAKLAPRPLLDPPKWIAGGATTPGVADAKTTAEAGSATWIFAGSDEFAHLPHGDFELRINDKTVRAHVHPPGESGH